MEKEKLVVSLFMACHHPGGKKRTSPGARTAFMDTGTTFFTYSGKISRALRSANTSTREVLFKLFELMECLKSDEEETGYIEGDAEGGASHTDL